jgi:hypothetical protein
MVLEMFQSAASDSQEGQLVLTYELVYGYVHCIGKTTYHAGFCDSVREAEKWVRQARAGKLGRVRVPDNDPIRWCPVLHCHMKAQKPWFGYRPADKSANNSYCTAFPAPEESRQAI